MLAIGLRAQKGGALVVAVDAGGPRVVLSTVLRLGDEGDRLATAPYAAAREMARDGVAPGDIAAAVAEGRSRQDSAAAEGLRGFEARRAALLVNRAGWITDLLSYSLEWAEHAPVADGLAVRDALRAGCRSCGIAVVEVDEKSLMDRAVDVLRLAPDEIEARLKAMGADYKPWRKEQKLAALAAWVAAQ